MRHATGVVLIVIAGMAGATPRPPIESVKPDGRGGLLVNDEPFFPLCSWLQTTNRYPRLSELGFNVFIGNWKQVPPSDAMGAAALAAGGYAVPHFDGRSTNHPGILGWMDVDEPDITSMESGAVITPGRGLILNKRAPLSHLVDGNTRNSAVLDPMAGARLTIELERPVTVARLAVWLPEAKPGQPAGTSVPRDVTFLGDGTPLLKAELAPKGGQQSFALPAAATFRSLDLQVMSVSTGANVWGLVNEIEAFDAQGSNVIKRVPKGVVRRTPEQSLAAYRRMKEADSARPVFLTLTCRFLPRYEQWHKVPAEQMRTYYPRWAEATDVLGTDIYPIYGFSRPEWLLDNIEAIKAMRRLAGPARPLYMWIETGDGGAQQRADLKVLPRHTVAEVWMCIIAGGRGIGYFTHAFKPAFSDFSPNPEMQAELQRLNARITRLAPAILAPEEPGATVRFEDGAAGHLLATRRPEGLYLFVQNLNVAGKDGLGGSASVGIVQVPGLKQGSALEVIDENRQITAAEGAFTDRFEALAEHVYLLRAPRK